MKVLHKLRNELLKVRSSSWFQQPFLVRNTQGDTAYLSPASGRDSTYISMIWIRTDDLINSTDFHDYRRVVEGVMRSFGARPHWGKLFQIGTGMVDKAYMKSVYPKYDQFVSELESADPESVFTNDLRKELFD